MAEEVIRIELGGSGGQAKSLQDLKKEYKDLQTELSKTKVGSEEYIQTLKKLGATKDDIGDLRDTISALNPEGKVAAFAKVGSTIASGFAAAQGAAALFGAESEELQKTMLKVQAAMALAEGIKGITAAGDAFKVLNTVMKANPILAIVAGFTALTAAVAVLYNSYKDANSESAKLEANHVKLKESTDSLTKSIDTEIQSLKGLKSNDEAILALTEKKLKLNIELERSSLRVALAKYEEQKAEFDYNEQALRLAGKNAEADKLKFLRTEESRKAAMAAGEALKASIAGLSEFQNIQTQKEIDSYSARVDAYKKMLDEKKAAEQKYLSESLTRQKQAQDEINKYIHDTNRDARKKLEDSVTEDDDKDIQAGFDKVTTKSANDKKAEEDARAEKQKTIAQGIEATKQGLQATQQLTDLYFARQLKQNKGNAAAELEIRKKQFKVNKAFGITMAIVDGARGVQSALAMGPPLGYVFAAISAVLAGINIAKIASSKFEGGESSASAGDVGGGISGASAPTIPQPNNTVTKIDDDGKVQKIGQPIVKAIVVESDMTEKQQRVNTIQESAKFG